jgi:hypothetical protein
MNFLLLKEFINKNMSTISGDEPVNQANSMSTSRSTTDDFVGTTRQGISRFSNYGRVYYQEDDEKEVDLPKKDKEKRYPKVPKNIKKKNNLKEVSKEKMDELIEDIFTKKDFDREFTDKKNVSDLRLNGIQPLDSIRETNPILIRKVVNLSELIEKNDISGEEKAIILNYLLSIDMVNIPSEYKEELKKKIR